MRRQATREPETLDPGRAAVHSRRLRGARHGPIGAPFHTSIVRTVSGRCPLFIMRAPIDGRYV